MREGEVEWRQVDTLRIKPALGDYLTSGIQPQCTKRFAVYVARTCAIEVHQVSCILERFPFFAREYITPRRLSSSDCLEATHLLHGVDFIIGELNLDTSAN